jgi:RNA polymerase sigma-70 factor (ECF subfamily)
MAGPRRDLSEDRAWLDGFRRGDGDALERVFRTYAPYALAIIRGGVGRGEAFAPGVSAADEQDDLLQEIFVRVLSPKLRASYDGLRPFAKFLGAVVRHVLIDHARKQGRLRRAEAHEVDLDGVADGAWSPGAPLPDALLLAKEEQALVGEFLGSLDTGETRFVDLRFEEGLSQRDVADNLGLSRQQVRTLEGKIRSRFAEFLKKR